ncbi:hypothetical protein APC1482_1477 [Bifidobacterium longum]|nr:hypothetical protein APC1482_1477 [Bifidobacterium longum]
MVRRMTAVALHTSKRMHFIEDGDRGLWVAQYANLHTSKRMHFIEEKETSA